MGGDTLQNQIIEEHADLAIKVANSFDFDLREEMESLARYHITVTIHERVTEGTWSEISNPRGFLWRAARLVCLRKLRDMRNQREKIPYSPDSCEGNVDEAVCVDEFLSSSRLSERDARIARMLLAGYKREEIAKELGVSRGPVSRSILHMRKVLERYYS